jgi:hypothetical protein
VQTAHVTNVEAQRVKDGVVAVNWTMAVYTQIHGVHQMIRSRGDRGTSMAGTGAVSSRRRQDLDQFLVDSYCRSNRL